jgi:hypothetical protein
MKNRVKIIKSDFFVNPEKKIVVCVLECDMQLEKHPTWDGIYSYMWSKSRVNLHVDNSGVFTVKAIARCNERDTFDENLGKKIAESKANCKAFAIAEKVYKEIEKYFLNNAALIHKSVQACEQSRISEKLHFDCLTNMNN